MKAIILAAGMSTRMMPLTENIPKPLLHIGSKTLLQYKIDSLKECGFNDCDIIIVAGYFYEKILDSFPRFIIINNPLYKTRNNLYSLWLCREHTKSGFILTNGDTIHCKEIFSKALCSSHESFITIDSLIKDPHDLSALVDDDGKLIRVEFNLEKEKILGKSVQFTKFSARDAAVFMRYIEDCFSREEFHKGANIMGSELVSRMNFRTLDIFGLPWIEVDTPQDLEEADQVVKNGNF
jgi:L-glutamine-phosphate cytidylyltransferase